MFQSTHPHGVRRRLRSGHYTGRMFQSTHPHGVRPISAEGLVNYDVSIHAPARGATLRKSRLRRPHRRFNPRTRTGCDRRRAGGIESRVSFNPRTRTGCDKTSLHAGDLIRVSIHAPARGATRVAYIEVRAVVGVSIHAPARGATKNNIRMCFRTAFQSTHPHGVRPCLPDLF